MKEISRREFLRTAALAGAGAVVSACAPNKPPEVFTPSEKSTSAPAKEPEVTPINKATTVPTTIPTKEPKKEEPTIAPEQVHKEEEYSAFLARIQEKVNKKRQVRAENDSDYLRRINPELNQNRVNILFLGLDRRAEEERDLSSNSWRADAPIIVSVNTESGQVDLLRIPRDLHSPEVDDLTSKHKDYPFRINAVTVFGDLEDARRIFENATGLSQDFCFSLDFNAFKEVVNILGGVTVDVDPSFVENYAQEIEDWLNNDLKPGRQRLSGGSAFGYIHWRLKDGDDARGKRQMDMIKAIAQTAVARIKEDPLSTTLDLGQLILRLKKEKGIGFASEFSLVDAVELINSARKINFERATDNFVNHNPWADLVYTPWSNVPEGDTVEYKERHQQFLVGAPIKDPADALDYWAPLRSYIEEVF